MMSIFIYFLCLLSIFIVSLNIISKKLQSSKWKLPPSPSTLPIIGNLHQVSGLLHRSIHKLCIKCGPVMLLRLGYRPMIVISSSEAAEEVLKTNDLECSSRVDMAGMEKLSYGYKDIAFSPYGAYWREMKKIAVIELFSLKKVHSFRYIREEEIGLMVKKISESSEALTQSPVDLSKTFFSLTASVICRVALGQNFHECEFIDQERIEELVTETADVLGDFTYSDLFPGGFGRFVDWLFGKRNKLNKVFKELDAFYQHVIDDHMKVSSTSDPPMDIVYLMLDILKKQGKEDSYKLNMDNVKAIVMDVFIAGIDTSAITMIWAMTELARNQRIMKKIQQEIRTTLGGDKKSITEEDLNKVEYLQHIIKETFRLHPPVPFVPRQTMSHIKIQGYDIPPQSFVQINVWTIGRDPKHWTDPEDFIPERFTNSSVDFRGQDFSLLPFGSGRRMCPAIPMASAAIELALLNMLYFFDWRLPDGMDITDINMEEYGTLSVVKKLPLMLVPVRHY